MKEKILCFSRMLAGSEINAAGAQIKYKTLSIIDDDGLLATRETIQTYIELDGTEIPLKIDVFQQPYTFLEERIEYQKQDANLFRKYFVQDYTKNNGEIYSIRKYLELIEILSPVLTSTYSSDQSIQ